jgi:hypothetical protein
MSKIFLRHTLTKQLFVVVVSSVVVVCIVVVSGCKAQVLQQVTSRLVAV